MNNRERIIKTFERENIDRPAIQIDLYPWYIRGKEMGKLPERYKNSSYIEICDDLGIATKGYEFFNSTIKIIEGRDVFIENEEKENYCYTYCKTPMGALRRITKKVKVKVGNSFYHESRVIEYPLKNPSDFRIIEYVLKERKVEFDWDVYEKNLHLLGDRVEPMLFVPRIPYQRLVIDYIGFENTIYSLNDYPNETEELMKVIEETDNQLYEVLEKSPIKIINFGDNIDSNLASPVIFEKYILPYYKKRTSQLKKAGKFTHAHWDGSVKLLLPFVKETGLDGIEALTPLPQGDVTLGEIKESLGNEIILLDGIPAIFFLDNVSYETLENFTKEILSLFKNNIILGISDELPQNGEIERVRFVSTIVDRYKNGSY